MKKERIFWGLFFIVSAVFLIVSRIDVYKRQVLFYQSESLVARCSLTHYCRILIICKVAKLI